jgi:glutaconate CoA-transferase subunit B
MSTYATDYTMPELMCAAIAREFRDGETAFIGVGPPLIGVMTAKFTNAPNLAIAVEAGGVGPCPRRVMTCVGDSTVTERAYAATSMFRVFSDQQRGFYDIGCISGAQIDRFGNVNSTCIGDYHQPQVRMAGSGGANDIGSSALRTVIMIRQERRRFPEKVDYLTIPGYLSGGEARRESGVLGGGPSAVISTMGVFRFDSDTKEMYLETVHPKMKVEQIKENVGWDLAVSPELSETEPPTEEEIEIMRILDPAGIYLGTGRQTLAGNWKEYIRILDESYSLMDKLLREKGML